MTQALTQTFVKINGLLIFRTFSHAIENGGHKIVHMSERTLTQHVKENKRLRSGQQ